MDKFGKNWYDFIKDDIGVIKLSAIPTIVDPKKKTNSIEKKPQSISELRKMLAIKTAPGHSLRELYKRG